MMTDESDLVIVGWGPAGLFATYYARLRELSVAVVDALPEPGGQVAALLPEKSIYDVAAQPRISGRELVDALLRQVGAPPDRLLLGHTAVDLQPVPGGWSLRTDQDALISSSAVVLTTGAGRFSARRLACAEPYLGSGATFAAAPTDAAGRDVVVVGGGDSAVDAALAVLPTAHSVTLVHRSERFRAHERSVSALRHSRAEILTDCEVTECHGHRSLGAVTVRDLRSGAAQHRPATLLIISLGLITRPGPLRDWGLVMEGNKVVVGADMRTNLPGVFAAGDVATYPGKVPLIVTGFGEAATAVNNAAAVIRPHVLVDPGHSSLRPPAPERAA